MFKRILVTGAAGFIGTNFVYQQLKDHPERELVLLDALTYAGNINNLKCALGSRMARFVRMDINAREEVVQLFKREEFDAVVHFAAESHVDRSIEDPGVFLRTNVLGTQNLLDAARATGVQRFHQVSTDEVYGDLPLDRPDLLFTESSPIRPSSPYSASKASADLLVQAYQRTYGLPVTISRCSNNYGAYQFPEKLIPKMIMLAMMDKRLPVYGKGLNIRDWLHVNDHCKAIDLILERGMVGEVYNIGGNNERTNMEVVHKILEAVGKPSRLIEHVKDRPGHDLRYAIDSTKIRNELGWTPVHDFENGLKETIAWYISNDEWIKNIVSEEYLSDNKQWK